jgi:hypothetical protein
MAKANTGIAILRLAIAVCAAGFPVREAVAWGEKAHVMINKAAIGKLPSDMPDFMRKSADLVGYLGTQPDRWRLFDVSLSEVGKPNHYFDMENINPDLSKITLPQSRNEFLEQLRLAQKKVDDVGLVPYELNEYYHRLRGGFMEYRWAARDPKGKEYRSPTRIGSLKSIETACLYYASILSHFAGDACQPLHATVFFDGRGPDGKPARTGVHLRYEIGFVNTHIKDEQAFSALVGRPRVIKDVIEEARQVLLKSNSLVGKVLEFDETGKLEKGDPEAVKMTRQRLADSSQFLLDLWYTAWIDSGKALDDYVKLLQSKD